MWVFHKNGDIFSLVSNIEFKLEWQQGFSLIRLTKGRVCVYVCVYQSSQSGIEKG